MVFDYTIWRAHFFLFRGAGKLNIIQYSHTYLPKIGGREIVIYQLGRSLKKMGHSVRVLGPRGRSILAGFKEEVGVHRYPRFSRNLITAGPTHQWLAEKEMLCQLSFDRLLWGGDIVHAHSLYPAGYVGALMKRRFPQTPLIITPHGVDINVVPESGYGMRLNGRLREKIDMALDAADLIIAISDGIHSSLLEAGVSASKIQQIPNGVDLERFKSRGYRDPRSYLQVPEDSKLILTVGNYSPLKGQENLIRAMKSIVVTEPKARLIIVGSNTESLRPLIDKFGVGDFVVLTGSIPMPVGNRNGDTDHLADIYRASSLYVSASIQEGAEGLSLSLLDGMAAGLPVVGTNITGNRDVIVNDVNGFLVSKDDHPGLVTRILELLGNPQLRTALGAQAREDAKISSWENIAATHEKAYRRSINLARLENTKKPAGSSVA